MIVTWSVALVSDVALITVKLNFLQTKPIGMNLTTVVQVLSDIDRRISFQPIEIFYNIFVYFTWN